VHELSITRDLVALVGEAAKGRRVVRVVLEVGTSAGVMPDAIGFCFDVVCKGTPLEGAELAITEVEGAALKIRTMEVEVASCA
jgi:hydrogenase nickel incorporation protein HypA/HybF